MLKLVFIHLEKTGGSSVVEAMKQSGLNVLWTDDLTDVDTDQYDVISGHLQVQKVMHLHCPVVTILRDPVERWLSYYRWAETLVRRGVKLAAYHNIRLKSFLRDPDYAVASAINYYAIMLPLGQDCRDAVTSSKIAVAGMDHVGFTEQLDAFKTTVGKMIGLEFPELGREKQSIPDCITLTHGRRLRLRERLADDYQIYDYARLMWTTPMFQEESVQI